MGTRELSQRLRKRRHFLKREFALFKNFKSIIPFCSVCQMKAIYFFKGLYIKVQKKKKLCLREISSLQSCYIDNIEFRSLSKLFFRNWLQSLPIAARLAQSVEHQTFNLRVMGSSPISGDSTFYFLICFFIYLFISSSVYFTS